jgi:hypothetical protein
LIDKLYKLKKTQTDQKLMQKAQLLSKIEKINIEIALTQNRIDTSSVQRYGAISDFMILTIHKNTMKMHIKELNNEKNILNKQVEDLVKDIIELQKESEQFSYILQEEKKEAIKKILWLENEEANEYIQSKYISKQKDFI